MVHKLPRPPRDSLTQYFLLECGHTAPLVSPKAFCGHDSCQHYKSVVGPAVDREMLDLLFRVHGLAVEYQEVSAPMVIVEVERFFIAHGTAVPGRAEGTLDEGAR